MTSYLQSTNMTLWNLQASRFNPSQLAYVTPNTINMNGVEPHALNGINSVGKYVRATVSTYYSTRGMFLLIPGKAPNKALQSITGATKFYFIFGQPETGPMCWLSVAQVHLHNFASYQSGGLSECSDRWTHSSILSGIHFVGHINP